MPLTPDRSGRGIDFDDAVQLADRGIGDPAIAAQIAYSSGAMRFRDSLGVYNPRTLFANLLSGASLDITGTLYCVTDGTVAPSLITWFSDASRTKKVCSKAFTYGGVNSTVPTIIVYSVFAADGTTLYKRATDTVSYTQGIFESSRVRIFS